MKQMEEICLNSDSHKRRCFKQNEFNLKQALFQEPSLRQPHRHEPN